MSENHEVSIGFGAVENGDSIDSHLAPVMDDAAGSAATPGASANFEPADVAAMPYFINQEPSSIQVDYLDHENGVSLPRGDSAENGPTDVRAAEDGLKEDMFVDCPDELIVSDSREAMAISEIQHSSEEKEHMPETRVHDPDNGTQVHEVIDELVHLRAMLEKTIGEKEGSAQAYKEERDALAKELANLHLQLKSLNGKQSLLIEINGGLDDGLPNAEMGELGENISLSDNPLHEKMNECSTFVRNILDVWSQTEGKFRELQGMLLTKDQEIEDLNAKVTELSISQDVAVSFLSSAQICSNSIKASQEVPDELQHIEAITDRVLASLSMAIYDEKLTDGSIVGKMSCVEKNTSVLVDKYNHFLSEVDQLKQSLIEVTSDFSVQGFGTTFLATRNMLLELKRKEVDLAQKVSNLEDENKKLVEQLDKGKDMTEMANADVEKLRVELEQEKTRFANTKEKLSLAVTKGKALVQQRDSLKQSLAEKTSELEKCLTELQEKSNALEAAEFSKQELVRTENIIASMQEALLKKDTVLAKCEEILSQTTAFQELQSDDIVERIKWIADERNTLTGVMLEYHKLLDVLSSIDLPEYISSSDLESRVSWLVESLSHSKAEANKLQDEIARTGEAACKEIEHLTTSLLMETQERIYLQEELNDLTNKYSEIIEKECQVSLEKNRMVSRLLEVSGITMDSQEEADQLRDGVVLVDRCFSTVIEQSKASFESSGLEAEMFERIQALLYAKDQELMLCEKLLDEEMLIRSKVSTLSEELRIVSQELPALKNEKSILQKDLERSEEKYAVLREKLSMAVKKGKGLVQERENLKKLLDERLAEIEKLKLELQQQESTLNECKDQISKLSADVELIPRLEADLSTMKDCKDQLEQFLAESNSILQRVIETVDGIVLPVDSTFEEPVEKLQWLARYLNECQVAKTDLEQELEKLKEESSIVSRKSAEAYAAKKSLEETLLIAENNLSLLAEEKRQLEDGKTHVEQELQKALEEASSRTSQFAEGCAMRRSLEDALAEAEYKISDLTTELEDAQASKAVAETELQKALEEASSQASQFAEVCAMRKSLEDALSEAENRLEGAQASKAVAENQLEKVKEEVNVCTSKIAESYGTIKSLEDALFQAERNVTLLSEENNKAEVGRTNLENEMKKLKEEADSQATKLADACSTIKSLEDALLKAENNISELADEKKNAEEKISALNSKLNACMEELAGTSGSLESRSLELSNQLNNFQVLLKDDTLVSLLKQSFVTKFQSLNDIDLLLEDMKDHCIETGSEILQSCPIIVEDFSASKFSGGLEDLTNVEVDIGGGNTEGGDSSEFYFGKIVESFHSRERILAEKVGSFSASMDEFIAALLKKLQATRDEVVVKLEEMRSLKEKVNNLDMGRQADDYKIAMMEKDIAILVSACMDATQELEVEVENILMKVSSSPGLEKLNNLLSEDKEFSGVEKDYQQGLHVKTAENLLLAARKVHVLAKQVENAWDVSSTTIKDLENKFTENRVTLENALEERDLYQVRLSKLESDLEALQSSYQEMRLKLEDYEAKEDKLSKKEAEMSSLRNALLVKEKEVVDTFLSASAVKALYDKIIDIDVPFPELNVGDSEFDRSDHVKKLFYIIDAVDPLRDQVNLLFHEKEELQSTLGKQVRQAEYLQEEIEEHMRHKQDLEKMKRELLELDLCLGTLIQKLGGKDLVGEQKSAGSRKLLLILEKLVMAVTLEAENSKSKAQELGAVLLGTQKVVDELSAKIKFLEGSNQDNPASPEGVQERSIFEAPSLPTRSEITEVEDVGPLGKNVVAPTPSAAHVRTLRKGSNDHLAINIDSESDRFIKKEETDEDKGHAFKSLNTSGLIPKQGKMIADRVDGIWVSGSRALMSRPRARLGLVAYCLILHIWLLGAIL